MINHDNCTVRVRGLAKSFGTNQVLKHIDLTVSQGEVIVIMGPSGSGKTTFIRSLNFLEVPDKGTVEICGIEITDPARKPSHADRRKIVEIRQKTAMVFQSFNLFPHMTALDNVIEGSCRSRGQKSGSPGARPCLLWPRSGCLKKRMNIQAGSRVARSSASRSHARWRWTPK
jgi:cystine transport system ATP-binding protein